MPRKPLALFIAWVLAGVSASFAAVRGHNSMYSAGTLTTCKVGTVGILEPSDTAVVFTPEGGGAPVSISYNSIITMEYGEHVMALPMLLSKKKRHYLTFYFNADSRAAAAQRQELATNPNAVPKGDVAAFEINKSDYAGTISILQAKTGLKVREEAAKR